MALGRAGHEGSQQQGRRRTGKSGIHEKKSKTWERYLILKVHPSIAQLAGLASGSRLRRLGGCRRCRRRRGSHAIDRSTFVPQPSNV